MASKLLWRLLVRAGRVQSREDLLRHVWGVPRGSGLRTRRVDMTVALLRRMMGKRCPVITVVGRGYVVRDMGGERGR